VTFFVGLVYGGLWVMMPAIVAESFGPKQFGTESFGPKQLGTESDGTLTVPHPLPRRAGARSRTFGF
jgi:hypothetical protein